MDTSRITLDVHTHQPLKQGYLTKQPVGGGTFASARRRFFVLTPVALEWYESETASAPKGLLPIEGARVEREGAGQNGGTLCITSGRERLVIHGDDLNGWETSLRAASGRVAAEIQAERKRADAAVAQSRATAEKADAGAAKARAAADEASCMAAGGSSSPRSLVLDDIGVTSGLQEEDSQMYWFVDAKQLAAFAGETMPHFQVEHASGPLS